MKFGSDVFEVSSIPPPLPWPKIRWRWEFLLGLLPFLMGLVPLFIPDLSNAPIYQRYRIPIGVILLASPVAIPLAIWLVKIFSTLIRRGTKYSLAIESAEMRDAQLMELKASFYNLLMQATPYDVFEISMASFYKGDLFVAVRSTDGKKLTEGKMLTIVDTNDAMILGVFKVVQIRADDYFAQAEGIVDPVLAGYIRQQQETAMLPHVVALSFRAGDRE